MEILIILFIILVPVTCSLVQFFMLRQMLIKVKIRLKQHGTLLRMMSKQNQLLENKVDSLSGIVANRDKEISFNPEPKDMIEHQYERAKRIMKKGSTEDMDILRSCNMTSEEVELLSGLIMNVE